MEFLSCGCCIIHQHDNLCHEIECVGHAHWRRYDFSSRRQDYKHLYKQNNISTAIHGNYWSHARIGGNGITIVSRKCTLAKATRCSNGRSKEETNANHYSWNESYRHAQSSRFGKSCYATKEKGINEVVAASCACCIFALLPVRNSLHPTRITGDSLST